MKEKDLGEKLMKLIKGLEDKQKLYINLTEDSCEIKGSYGSILNGLSSLVHILKYENDFEEEDIKKAIETGLLTEEEIKEKAKEIRKKTSKKVESFLDELLETFNEGEDDE